MAKDDKDKKDRKDSEKKKGKLKKYVLPILIAHGSVALLAEKAVGVTTTAG